LFADFCWQWLFRDVGSFQLQEATQHDNNMTTTNPSELIVSYIVKCPARGEVFYSTYFAANKFALAFRLPVIFVFADGSTFEQI